MHEQMKPRRYVQYDPELVIDGQPLRPLGDEAFKMLGRKLYASLSEVTLQADLEAELRRWMATIDNTSLKGAMKAWLYNHCVVSRLAWPFLVYDFSVTIG